MDEIKIENEEELNFSNGEQIDEEISDETEGKSFKPRKIFDDEKKQTLADIYNDETLKQIQKPPRTPVRRFFIGLIIGLIVGLITGFLLAILFLRYF